MIGETEVHGTVRSDLTSTSTSRRAKAAETVWDGRTPIYIE